MNCPRDNTPLRLEKKGNLEIYLCPECSGFLVLLSQKATDALERQLKKSFTESGEKSKGPGLVSPSTGSEMRPFNYRGVTLDYCPTSHSIWFDRGEYSQMFKSATEQKKLQKAQASMGDFSPSKSKRKRDYAADVGDVLIEGVDVFDLIGDLVSGLTSGFDIF